MKFEFVVYVKPFFTYSRYGICTEQLKLYSIKYNNAIKY